MLKLNMCLIELVFSAERKNSELIKKGKPVPPPKVSEDFQRAFNQESSTKINDFSYHERFHSSLQNELKHRMREGKKFTLEHEDIGSYSSFSPIDSEDIKKETLSQKSFTSNGQCNIRPIFTGGRNAQTPQIIYPRTFVKISELKTIPPLPICSEEKFCIPENSSEVLLQKKEEEIEKSYYLQNQFSQLQRINESFRSSCEVTPHQEISSVLTELKTDDLESRSELLYKNKYESKIATSFGILSDLLSEIFGRHLNICFINEKILLYDISFSFEIIFFVWRNKELMDHIEKKNQNLAEKINFMFDKIIQSTVGFDKELKLPYQNIRESNDKTFESTLNSTFQSEISKLISVRNQIVKTLSLGNSREKYYPVKSVFEIAKRFNCGEAIFLFQKMLEHEICGVSGSTAVSKDVQKMFYNLYISKPDKELIKIIENNKIAVGESTFTISDLISILIYNVNKSKGGLSFDNEKFNLVLEIFSTFSSKNLKIEGMNNNFLIVELIKTLMCSFWYFNKKLYLPLDLMKLYDDIKTNKISKDRIKDISVDYVDSLVLLSSFYSSMFFYCVSFANSKQDGECVDKIQVLLDSTLKLIDLIVISFKNLSKAKKNTRSTLDLPPKPLKMSSFQRKNSENQSNISPREKNPRGQDCRGKVVLSVFN